MRRCAFPAAVVALACGLGLGCTAGGTPSSQTAVKSEAPKLPEPELSPVALPDVSSLPASVQRQLRDRFDALTQVLGNPNSPASERAAAYAAFGRLLMASTFSDDAALCYVHAEALAADDFRWPYLLGHAYLRTGDRPRAVQAFDRASKLRPAALTALVWLGETHLDDGRPDAAQAAFQQALSLQPQSAVALFGAGRAALARQAYLEAVRYMEGALSIDSAASAVHYPLAMAYRALGDQEKTEAHLRQRGSTFPDLVDSLLQRDDELIDSAVAHEGRGVQALKRADWPAAEAAFRQGLALQPDDASLRYWLGATLYASGDTAGGQREFEAVLRHTPNFAKAHFSLGAIFEARGRRPAAIEHYRAAVEHDPKMPEARLRLAEALRATGQLQASLIQYETAVSIDPAVVEAWVGGAEALIGLGLNQQASEWLVRARRLHPNQPALAALQAKLPPVKR